jgi:2-dehydropantoate 2-reductase
MKVGIYGAGSIGSFIGGHLLNSGLNVVFIGREKLQKQILENGLSLTGISHPEIFLKNINYSTNPNDLKDRDIILFTMKSADTLDSAKKILDFADEKIIISFQNGVQNANRISSVLVKSHVLKGMVPYNVVNLGNGKFHSGTSGDLYIEKKENISLKVEEIFKKTKLKLKTVLDMESILWGKLIFNLNNSINALAGVPLKEELENYEFRKILASVMIESLDLLKKLNIKPKSIGKMIPWLAPKILSLPNFLFFRVAKTMIQIDPKARSSMWEDLENFRKTEFNFINGEILELAKKNSIKVPIQEKLKILIEKAEQEKKGSPNFSSEELSNLLFSVDNF